jgi:DNA replication licensing factor MCM2
VTSLHARCSVIAAANPIGGVYRQNQNFNDNVDLTDPILSRFDLLTVIKDNSNEEIDDALATFVLNSHMKSHPKIRQLQGPDSDNYEVTMDFLKKNMLPESNIKKTDSSNQVDQDLLKKYIMYAKRMVHPKLNEIDREKVT